MSDWIEVNGRKYYEESYLILANNNAKRRGEQLETARLALGDIRRHQEIIGGSMARLSGIWLMADGALAQIGAEHAGASDTPISEF